MYDQSQSRVCCHTFREEFQFPKLSLSHEPPSDFCRSQWQIGQRSFIWLIYRWILAAFFTTCVLGIIHLYFQDGRRFIYFTSWGFALCMLACLYGAIVATLYYINQHFFVNGSLALKIYWLAHNTALVVALLITLMYWTAVYPTLAKHLSITTQLYGILAHACTSVFMLLDHFLVAFPTRIMHFIYPFVFCLIYAHFTYFYYLAGGTDVKGRHFIYEVLNWSHPVLAIVIVSVSLSMVFVISLMLFWLHRLRLWLSKGKRSHESNNGNA